MSGIKERIRDRARELGFSHAGFAAVAGTDALAERLLAWLARGFHGDMAWLARDPGRRADPGLVLPGARTVIMLAMNYYTPFPIDDTPDTAKISRYAWGDDYHDVVLPRLHALETVLKDAEPGAESRAYVDTGPVMEKAWAERAGLGWIGKNTCVLTRDAGSWLFLGAILTTASIEPDAPAVDWCGTCTACIDACPTHAIVAPYVLDATKCISYLTIECKSAQPGEGGVDYDGWVFGCDVCQDVCPWNRFATPTTEQAFQPRPRSYMPKLADLLLASDEDFRASYAGSPVMRAKSARMRRNAGIVSRRKASNTD